MIKGEIDQPKCFQCFYKIKLSYMEIFHVFVRLFSKKSAADLLYMGMGLFITIIELGQSCILLNLSCIHKLAADDF